jgi:hypothetical protein
MNKLINKQTNKHFHRVRRHSRDEMQTDQGSVVE